MVRHGLIAGVAVCLVLGTTAARADELTLSTDLGSWDDAIAELRADLGSEGRALRVAVHASGASVPCERYLLQLDEGAGRAFRATTCDPATHETVLLLAHREALFDERFDVPRPRTVTITAILRATAVAQGGAQGGSLVRCSVAVRPYLDDALHGTRVMLTPERYALRPGAAWVSVSPEPGGWSLSTEKRAVFRLHYTVVDRATGEVVLEQDTTLSCGPDAPSEVTPEARPDAAPAVVYQPLPAALYPVGHAGPSAHAPGQFNTVAGVLSLAFLGTMTASLSSAGFQSSTTSRDVFYTTGALAGAGAVAAGSVFLASVVEAHPWMKTGAQPSVSLSNRGGAVGATWSF